MSVSHSCMSNPRCLGISWEALRSGAGASFPFHRWLAIPGQSRVLSESHSSTWDLQRELKQTPKVLLVNSAAVSQLCDICFRSFCGRMFSFSFGFYLGSGLHGYRVKLYVQFYEDLLELFLRCLQDFTLRPTGCENPSWLIYSQTFKLQTWGMQ